MDPILIIFFIIFGGVVAMIYKFKRREVSRWKSHPTMDEYLTKNPECKTRNGLMCSRCGSGSIKNWGLFGSEDTQRLFICNHCGENLYRSS